MTADLLYRWPASAHFGRVVPKTKFYERGKVTTAVREKFVAEVQRITWAYKLADSTIHLRGSDDVPEIQVFVLEAKDEDISDAVLTTIDAAVQFPIIFEIQHGADADSRTRMTASHKQLRNPKPKLTGYFSTGWMRTDRQRAPLPTALDLPGLYLALLAPVLPVGPRAGERLTDTTTRVEEYRKLEREIATLERQLRTESQFNRKVELRRELRDRAKALEDLRSPQRPIAHETTPKEPRWTS